MKKLTLSVLLCFATHAVAEGLPDLGDISQSVLTPLQERQIGQQSMMQIRASRQFLDDPEVNDYLNQIGDRLVASSNEPALNFEFFAVNDETVNAFAIPGGFIGVNIGLVLTTQSESELASVLAHEIAHVTQHHYARLLSATQNDGLTSMAAIAVAILAARNSPQASQAAIMGAQARAVQKQLDFTRLHEQEADRIGLELLQKSGFNIHAMPEFLQRLQRATRLLEGNAPNYMRTHPITSERIADIENRVSKQPYRLIADSLDFQLIRTKLIAHQKSTVDAISYFEHALTDKKFGNPVAQRYGLVLSLLSANDATRAKQEMDTLRAQAQGNALLDTLTGQVIAAQKDDQATLNYYKTAVLNHPQYRALIYDYAQLLIRTGQSALASQLLNDRISRYPADVTLYNLQAHAYQQLNKPLEQHQAQAYSYAWQGNIHAAIEQLELAKQAGGSFYQMSTIESDLRELRDLVDTRGRK